MTSSYACKGYKKETLDFFPLFQEIALVTVEGESGEGRCKWGKIGKEVGGWVGDGGGSLYWK